MARLWFAWVDALDEVFDPAVHARLDEQDLRVADWGHAEGEAAVMSVQFKNPGVGLLSPGRRQAALISVSEDDDPASAVLVFRGRVVGVPTALTLPFVRVELIAAPENLQERLEAFAAANAALPFDEPLVASGEDAATRALAARGAFYYVDPATHAISLSDVIEGDRVVDIGADHWWDRFDWQLTEPPVASARIRARVPWTQRAHGTVNVGPRLGELRTLAYADPPVEFVNLSPGWEIVEDRVAVAVEPLPVSADPLPTGSRQVDSYDVYEFVRWEPRPGSTTEYRAVYRKAADGHFDREGLYVALMRETKLRFEDVWLSYDYEQPREEIVEVLVSVGVQPVLGTVGVHDLGEVSCEDPTLDLETPVWFPGRETAQGEHVQMNGKRYVATATNANASFYFYTVINGRLVSVTTPDFEEAPWIAPLGQKGAATFLDTPRGEKLVEHLVRRARAFLRMRLRAIRIGLSMPWHVADGITLRDVVRAFHPALGTFEGKVVQIRRTWDGDAGRTAQVVIACALGDGSGAAVPIEADVAIATSADPALVPVETGLLSAASYAVSSVTKQNETADQVAALATPEGRQAGPGGLPTVALATLRSLAAEDVLERRYYTTATVLRSPRQFDAEAA